MLGLGITMFTPTVLADHRANIHHAWIADAPPVAKIRAGYLKLHNDGKHTILIKDFNSPDFKRVELHKTVVEGGMVKMEEVKQLNIKPGEQVEFKPGGYHLMLFNPKRKLKPGDKINFSIRFKDGITTTFTAEVKKRSGKMHQEHNHDHHNHH